MIAVILVVAAFGGLAGDARAAGGAAAKAGAAAKTAALPPLTLDSLQTEDVPRAYLAAGDAGTLARLRREVDYAANSFRRFIGTYPPKLGIAAVGDLREPSRFDAAAAKRRGIDYVVTDWPAAPRAAGSGPPPATPVALPALSERVARWQLRAFETSVAKGTPPAGKARFTPDWFEAAIGGLATLPAEQNRRAAWMRANVAGRIPIAKFLEMARPSSAPAKGKVARKGAASAPAAEAFDAQALSFGRFLAEREGERFLGHAHERMLQGEPQQSAFNIAKTLLPHPDVLEKEWVAWMKESGGEKAAP